MAKLNNKWLDITTDQSFSSKKITDLSPGVAPTDGVNVSQLSAAVESANDLTDLVFGPSSNASIDDGAVPIDSTSNAADVVEDINSILGELVPPASPDLSDISKNVTGVSGKLSFGASNAVATYTNHPSIDINGTMPNSANNAGIIPNTSFPLTGTLNSAIPAHAYAYPADSFGDADKGTLSLIVNGATIHSVDLSTFGSGSDTNGFGSGFNLSAATPVSFSGGGTFTARKYRTGTYTVASGDGRNGYNTVQISHSESGSTNTFVYIVDSDATATTYGSEAFGALAMTGSNDISGVEYNTGGTVPYSVTINNVHQNTYSGSGSAISHPTTTNCSTSSTGLGTISDETDTEVITDQSVTIDSSRILPSGYMSGSGNSVAVSTRSDRTVQSDVTSTGVSQFALLVDPTSDSASNLAQGFDGESRRFTTAADFSSTSTSVDYDSSVSLVGSYTTELQCYNSRLVYPSYNFGGVANAPGGNPNYSGASGTRYFYGYFTNSTGTANFRWTVNGSGLTLVDVDTFNAGSAHVTLEMRLPTLTGWMDCMKSFQTGQWLDGDGCYSASLGSDTTISTSNLGATVGTISTASSGDRIYWRVKMGAGASSGYLTQVSVIWNAS